MQTKSDLPGVEDRDAGGGKVGGVAGDDGHVVDQGCGGDEGVVSRCGNGDVKLSATKGYLRINCQGTIGE